MTVAELCEKLQNVAHEGFAISQLQIKYGNEIIEEPTVKIIKESEKIVKLEIYEDNHV